MVVQLENMELDLKSSKADALLLVPLCLSSSLPTCLATDAVVTKVVILAP